MEDIAQYYISINGEQAGPFGKTVLAGKIAGGHLTAETLVWKDGMESWKAAGEVEDLAALFAKNREDAEKAEAARRNAEEKKPEPAPAAENPVPPPAEEPAQAATPQTTKGQVKQFIIIAVVGGIILGFITSVMGC